MGARGANQKCAHVPVTRHHQLRVDLSDEEHARLRRLANALDLTAMGVMRAALIALENEQQRKAG